ncbi:MAG TPA: glycosyltransferase family 2 protein [Acidimicrobiia bacterium]
MTAGQPVDDAPLVSFLVVTFRQHRLLARLLDSLERAGAGIDTETIVVVNGVPLQPEHEQARARGATVVQAPVNLGFPGGLHYARNRARGAYLAIVQDDTVLDDDWLSALVKVLDTDRSVGIAGSRMAAIDGELYGDGLLVSSDAWVKVLEPMERAVSMWAVDASFSAACLVRADAWDQVGGPNPRLFPLWMVDVDLGLRLNEVGWTVLMVGDTRARHELHASSTTWLRRYLDERHRRIVGRAHREYLAGRPDGLFGKGEVAATLRLLEDKAERRRTAPLPNRTAQPLIAAAKLERWARLDAMRIRVAMPLFRVRSAVGYRWRVARRSLKRPSGAS